MDHTLTVGQTARLVKSIVKASVALTYTGMSDPDTYTVAVWWSYGNNSLSYNMYLSIDQKKFDVPKGTIYVEMVNRGMIKFEFRQA